MTFNLVIAETRLTEITEKRLDGSDLHDRKLGLMSIYVALCA